MAALAATRDIVLCLPAIHGLLAVGRVARLSLLVEIACGQLLVTCVALWGGAPQCAASAAVALVLTLALAPLRPEGRVLPLNGVDRYFIAQSYRGFSPNSHVLIDTREPLDGAAIEKAAASLMEEVPLLRSFVREGFLSVQRFEARKPWLPASRLVRREEDPVPEGEDPHVDDPFDLSREPPWRIHTSPRVEGGHRLCLSIHHSLCDGTGLLLLCEWLLRGYGEATGGEAAMPSAGPAYGPRYRTLLRPHGIAWLFRMVRRHVRPMDKVGVVNASLLDDRTPRPWRRRYQLITLPRARMEALKEAASRSGLSRNDLLVTAVLRAGDGWRRARGKPDRKFRLLLPTDLRPTLGLPPSLQNYVGVVRSEFLPQEIRSPDLSRLVSERVRLGRALEEAIETPVNLGVLSAILPPWLFRRELEKFDNDPRSFFFSLLVSNMRAPGVLPVPPGVTVERIFARGTFPRQPGVGLVFMTEPDRMTITLDYLTPQASDAGMADFRARLEEEIAGLTRPDATI